MTRKQWRITGTLGLVLASVGCDQDRAEPTEIQAPGPVVERQPLDPPRAATEPLAERQEPRRAEADIQAAEGKKIDGDATFEETPQGVRVVVRVEDGPAGKKGVHIHEKGDCSNIPGESMGSHFAPQGHKHALPSEPQAQRHLGDLGNLEIAEDGTGKLEITVEKANLKEGDRLSFLGKALVIHDGEDQGASQQPSGGSGTPMACAVIKET